MRDRNFADLEAARVALGTLRARDPAAFADAKRCAAWLYNRWYHATAAGERDYPDPPAYAAATALPALFESGWRADAVTAEGLAAAGPRGRRVIAMGDYAFADPVAATGALRVLDRVTAARGGWWHWWSRAWVADRPARIERVYLNAAPGRETDLAAAFAAAAPPDAMWYIKLLTGRLTGGRRDSAVLFLQVHGHFLSWVERLIADVAPLLAEGTPRFAMPLGPGAAWTEDPGIDGASFGTHICAVLARAAPAVDDPGNFAHAAVAQGLDLAAPHRCAQ